MVFFASVVSMVGRATERRKDVTVTYLPKVPTLVIGHCLSVSYVHTPILLCVYSIKPSRRIMDKTIKKLKIARPGGVWSEAE